MTSSRSGTAGSSSCTPAATTRRRARSRGSANQPACAPALRRGEEVAGRGSSHRPALRAMTARLTRRPGGPAWLRALLGSGRTIVAPGAFDPLAARLVEEAGFPAVYMIGFGTSAALLGRPDVGLLTMTEMAGNAARIAACVDMPAGPCVACQR